MTEQVPPTPAPSPTPTPTPVTPPDTRPNSGGHGPRPVDK